MYRPSAGGSNLQSPGKFRDMTVQSRRLWPGGCVAEHASEQCMPDIHTALSHHAESMKKPRPLMVGVLVRLGPDRKLRPYG